MVTFDRTSVFAQYDHDLFSKSIEIFGWHDPNLILRFITQTCWWFLKRENSVCIISSVL